MLHIDQRWRGAHGIGRFAQEVTDRLQVNYVDSPKHGSPSSPLDVLSPWRLYLSKFDLTYSPGYNAGLTLATQLVTLHDLIHLDSEGPKAYFMRVYYEQVIKPAVVRAGAVFTVSKTSQDAIREWLAESKVDILNVGNGCSDVFLDATPITTAPESFLYVGNLKPHKNFDVILRALRLRPEYNLTAVISDRESAERKVQGFGLSDRVEIVNGLSDSQLAKYYGSSIGLLMPSLIEGFGLPAVESLACARPVAYWAGCRSVAEIVGDHGVSVTSEVSPDDWAEGMDRLVALSQSFVPPDSVWRDQYRWDKVAARVDDHLVRLQKA